MFTGIVEERGEVLQAGSRLVVAARTVLGDAFPGASVAVNGVCLTVVELGEGTVAFDLSEETLSRSSLGTLVPGDPVNLERPVTLLSRLGGHLVQGHVDGVGAVRSVDGEETERRVTIDLPDGLARYCAEKGSIAVDGVSLTVNRTDGTSFEVALVPHTLSVTTLGALAPGDPVNVEVDVMAKYVETLMRGAR
jgi:riboflavin synthase